MRIICSLSTLPNPGSAELENSKLDEPGIFVVRHERGVSAYLNRCPHTGAPLNWQPNQFLNAEKTYIQCALHGALFRLEDGLCIAGPCVSRSLTALASKIENNQIMVDISL